MKHLSVKLIILFITIGMSTSIMAQMSLEYNTNLGNDTLITIPLSGTVSVTIDWGDGNSASYDTFGNIDHAYSTNGIYTVTISGTLTQFGFGNNMPSNAEKLVKVNSFGSIGLTSLSGAFKSATNLIEVPTSLPNTITDLSSSFSGCGSTITNLDAWDVSNVTNMSSMFASSNFNQDISGWDVGNVTDMSYMFYGASSFDQSIGNWTVGAVTDMSFMFASNDYSSDNLFNQDINGWNVSNVTNMSHMFYKASSFNQAVGSWNVSSVTNMSHMFYKASSFNKTIGNWTVSALTEMSYMFYNAHAFNQDISGWDVSNITNMEYLFYNNHAFNQDISSWDVENVTNMSRMFCGANSFNQNIGNWKVVNVIKMDGMFFIATNFNQDISGWDVSNVENMNEMFASADAFNINIGGWDVSSVTTMGGMFAESLNFNQVISGWDVSKVTNMAAMFRGSKVFNQNIDSWSVSNVTGMYQMFQYAEAFNQDIGSWDVSAVTDMSSMFEENEVFNKDIGDWNVSAVTNMSGMFFKADNFNQDISDWNVSNVESLYHALCFTSLSQENYNALLIKWSALNLYDSVRFDLGDAQYSSGAAADARAAIIANKHWKINDGGEDGSYIWVGTAKSSSWNVAANWSDNKVPTAIDHVVIPELFDGSDIYIGNGITGDCNNLQINSDGILNINSGASFINQGSITNNGTINVKRTIPDGEWHLISIPNDVTKANAFMDDFLQTWDETSASWSNITDENTALTKGKGYSLYGVAKSTTYNFEGTPNTGDISTAITYTDNGGGVDGNDGANFLGNPYTSSIDWDDLNETYGAVYVWNSSTQDYEEWHGSGPGVQYIPPMQGFFIVIDGDSPDTFELTNSMRTHNGANEYYKSSTINNGVVLTASNASFEDQLFIRFDDASSADFELQNDAYKLLSNSDGVSQLYSYAGEKKFSIDVRPETDVIQLGFQNNQNGNYQIGLGDINHISSVILEDTKTETLHNLINSDYEFEWNTSDNKKRFKLHMKATGINDILSQNIHLYAHQKTIYIQSKEGLNNAQITIADMMGRVVYDNKLSNGQNEAITLTVEDGVYIVNLISGNGVHTEKVILK